jgi:hypothetical protein
VVAEAVVLTFGVHVYVNVPVPPLAVTLAEPSVDPQFAAVMVPGAATTAVGSLMVTVKVLEHPLPSVTVTV